MLIRHIVPAVFRQGNEAIEQWNVETPAALRFTFIDVYAGIVSMHDALVMASADHHPIVQPESELREE